MSEYVWLDKDWRGNVHELYYLRKMKDPDHPCKDDKLLLVYGSYKSPAGSMCIMYSKQNSRSRIFDSRTKCMDEAWRAFLAKMKGYERVVNKNTLVFCESWKSNSLEVILEPPTCLTGLERIGGASTKLEVALTSLVKRPSSS